MKLSILTPSVPSRLGQLIVLCEEVSRQISATGTDEVEHLVLLDNKKRTIGEKRQALLEIANGDFIAFVDDDDWIRRGYVKHLLKAIEEAEQNECDVITFEQMAYFDGKEGRVIFGVGNDNEEWQEGKDTLRAVWHVCAWRRTVALQSKFPAKQWGEDWEWAEPLNRLPLSSIHIPEILHEYHYVSEVTEAK